MIHRLTEIIIAAVLALVFAALFDAGGVLGKAMARLAAKWWHHGLDTPADTREELQDWIDYIDSRGSGLIKLGVGLQFLGTAVFRHGSFLAVHGVLAGKSSAKRFVSRMRLVPVTPMFLAWFAAAGLVTATVGFALGIFEIVNANGRSSVDRWGIEVGNLAGAVVYAFFTRKYAREVRQRKRKD